MIAHPSQLQNAEAGLPAIPRMLTEAELDELFPPSEEQRLRGPVPDLSKVEWPEDENGELWMDLDDEGRAILADSSWIHDQFNRGALNHCFGQYVAVVNKVLLGHDKSLRVLRERVVRETGHPVERIVTSFIDRFDR